MIKRIKAPPNLPKGEELKAKHYCRTDIYQIGTSMEPLLNLCRKCLVILIFISVFSTNLLAQVSELDSLLQNELDNNTTYTIATFKSTRIINGHSVERMQKKDLDFRISHRFGNINSGAYEFFGLDHSSSNLNLEYGLFNWIMIGVGRATYQKTFTGFTKISFLRQSKGKIKINEMGR